MKDVGSEIAIPRFNKLKEAIQGEADFDLLKIRDTGLARMLDKNTTGIYESIILDSGKPILMTSLVFGISFSVLILSGLEAISVLGLSMLIGCTTALLVDLFILPGM